MQLNTVLLVGYIQEHNGNIWAEGNYERNKNSKGRENILFCDFEILKFKFALY